MELHATFIQNMCNLSSFSMVLCSFVIAAWGGQLYDRLKNLTEVMWSLRWTFKMPSPAESFSAWQKLQPICEWWAEGLLWSLSCFLFFFWSVKAEADSIVLLSSARPLHPWHHLAFPQTHLPSLYRTSNSLPSRGNMRAGGAVSEPETSLVLKLAFPLAVAVQHSYNFKSFG